MKNKDTNLNSKLEYTTNRLPVCISEKYYFFWYFDLYFDLYFDSKLNLVVVLLFVVLP